ncbi:hypothetical protein Y032_0261g557 [Ancylostoma ceylanicum]|uniref:Uncharacterized protein n=2 Tax=Ancylostoma ceylanicum TaxID=53326 RepID=A0A016SA43_9BILA|nr:hypothetical protein Y032_0261g557 [Ancylostoma ceylanicum]
MRGASQMTELIITSSFILRVREKEEESRFGNVIVVQDRRQKLPKPLHSSLEQFRADSPDTAIEYDQKELDALKRMKEVAESQVKGLSLINDMRKDTSFVVTDDDVRAVREAEERYLNREVDAHLKAIAEGKVNNSAILMIMSPLCNYVERLEIETRNLLSDIQGRQADVTAELEHVENINRILTKDLTQNNNITNH